MSSGSERKLELTDNDFHDLAELLNEGHKPIVKVKRDVLWRMFRDYGKLLKIAGKEVREESFAERVRRKDVS